MKFRTVSEEEVRRIDKMQAEYFGRSVHIFEPPYPEGVPERLEKIVAMARISGSDNVLDIGTGTGALIPMIRSYSPAAIYANDLSEEMLEAVAGKFPEVETVNEDISRLGLADDSLDVFFINGCYPNIVDKDRCFKNIHRMIRPGGRVVISHPMGRKFVEFLEREMPFPVEGFPPSAQEAQDLFAPYGFDVKRFVDEDELYILMLGSV